MAAVVIGDFRWETGTDIRHAELFDEEFGELEELASEKRWDMAFANSQDLLSRLADEALAEHRAGKTKLLDPDKL